MVKRLTLFMILALAFFVLNVLVGATQSQEAELRPLTEPGPYGVNVTTMNFSDKWRENWELEARIMYPADQSQGTRVIPSSLRLKDAPPDRSGAPYPLIIYSPGFGQSYYESLAPLELLVSNGYVVASIQHHDADPYSREYVDRPLDILTILDGLAAIRQGELAGMIDTDNTGMMGYSQGAIATLQMLGLLSDPVHYKNWCDEHDPNRIMLECRDVDLEDTTGYIASLGLGTGPDGQWPPFGDTRITAALAIAAGAFPLTNEEMLSETTVPIMIMHGTDDPECDYQGNAVRTYNYLGTEDRYLVTLVGGDHFVFEKSPSLVEHFAMVFFGHYLHGDEAYAAYLAPEALSVLDIPELVWGPYEDG